MKKNIKSMSLIAMMFSIVMLASFIVISVMDIPVSKTVVAEAAGTPSRSA